MTARPEFGAAIAVEGVRPAWLADDVEFRVWNANRYTLGRGTAADGYDWEDIQDIVLEVPRYDFVYLALERGMVPWFGGDEAPGDWDGGPILFRDGHLSIGTLGHRPRWHHVDLGGDIIGYTRKATSTALPFAIDWSAPIEAVHETGRTRALKVLQKDAGVGAGNDHWCWTEDGQRFDASPGGIAGLWLSKNGSIPAYPGWKIRNFALPLAHPAAPQGLWDRLRSLAVQYDGPGHETLVKALRDAADTMIPRAPGTIAEEDVA